MRGHSIFIVCCVFTTFYFFRCYLNCSARFVRAAYICRIVHIRGGAWQRSCNDSKEAVVRCHKREVEYESCGVTWALSLNASSALINPSSAGNNNVASERSDWVRQADLPALITITTGENWEYSLCPSTHETVQSLWLDFRIGEIAYFSEICHCKSLKISSLRKTTVSGRERNKKEVGIGIIAWMWNSAIGLQCNEQTRYCVSGF